MILPSARVIIETEDVSADLLAFRHALAVLGSRRQARNIRGYAEAILEANRGLAAHGLFIRRGSMVTLPEFETNTEQKQVRRLWD